MHKSFLYAIPILAISGCSSYTPDPAGRYTGYNCNQLYREQAALKDETQQAADEQSTSQIYQLAITAFALSNGDSYNARSDTSKTDRLKAQSDEVRREMIRKQCD